MHRISSRMAATTLAVLAAVVLSGCLRVESSFDIHDDGTADAGILIAFDLDQLKEFAEMFGQPTDQLDSMSGQELLSELGEGTDPCADLEGSFGDLGVTSEEYDQDGLVGVRCAVEGIPIDQVSNFGDDSTLSITQSDGATSFDLTLTGMEELIGGGEEIPLPNFSFEELFEMSISASAPGSLSDHNATSTSGSTATWVITPDADFLVGDEAVLTAAWEPGGGDGGSADWVLPLLIALAVVAVLAGIGVVLSRRAEHDEQPDDPSKGSPPASTPPPPPPPQPGSTTGPDVPAPPSPGSPPTSSAPPPPPGGAPGPDSPPSSSDGGWLPPPTA